jgi:hypothetical protein
MALGIHTISLMTIKAVMSFAETVTWQYGLRPTTMFATIREKHDHSKSRICETYVGI